MSIIRKFWSASCNQFCIKTNQSLKREKNIFRIALPISVSLEDIFFFKTVRYHQRN